MEFCGVGGYTGLIRLAEDDVKSLLLRVHQADNSNKVVNIFISVLKWIATFTIVVIGWILFRVNNISDFFYIMGHLFDGISNLFLYIKGGLIQLGLGGRALYELIVIVLLFVIGEIILENKNVVIRYLHPNRQVRWIIYILMFLFILFMMPVSGNRNFIYFQF